MENAVCHFVFYTGPRKGEAQVYNTARVSIGRASNCDFRLEAFQLEQVAPHHAEVLLEEGKAWYLYDLGTKSGTYVNGERVHDRCALISEDYIRFGQEGPEVIFRTGPAASGKQPLPEVFPVTAELEFFSGSDAGRIFPINAAVTSNIGRRADLEVPLDPRGDMIVSGNHCNIRYVNGHFVLTDTSRNGTYVNGELVDQPMEILDGDVIMLGDGGPQSRFHVDDAKRHYPNHRALSPVSAKTEPASTSSFRAGDAAAPATLASAKPFLTGTPAPKAEAPAPPPPDAELSDEAETVNQEVAAAESAPETTIPAGATEEGVPDFLSKLEPSDVPDAEDAIGDDVPADSSAEPAYVATSSDEDDVPPAEAAAAPPAASRPARKMPDFKMPDFKKLSLTRNQKIIGLAGAGIVLLIILVALFSGGDEAGTESAGRGNYAAALKSLTPVQNQAGAFTVNAPEGWTTLNRENYVSVESLDKNLIVDYVRDPRANSARLQDLLTKNGAKIDATDSVDVDGQSVEITRSSIGNIRRAGAVIPAAGAPVLAIIEGTEDALDGLDKKEIAQLLVENVEITGSPENLPAPSAATPPPAAPPTTPVEPAPSPQAAKADTQPPAPESTPAKKEQPATSPTPAADDTATTAPSVTSNALGLTITTPEGWTGTSEEDDEMLMFSDGKDLVVRIARDPGDLDAEATFKAMEEEDWTKEGVQNSATYHAGEFSGQNQNLMLVLIPEKASTTLLIYATSPKDFTLEQRKGISDIMRQLLPPAE